jgi:hypothetical protein
MVGNVVTLDRQVCDCLHGDAAAKNARCLSAARKAEIDPLRHLSKMRNLVIIGAQRTWPNLILVGAGSE